MAEFIYVTYIRTTPKRLWTALTDPEFTRQYWWGRRLESDWKPGSEVKAVYEKNRLDWQGKVLVYEPYTKLSYTFHPEEMPSARKEKPSVVTFEISQEDKGTVKLIVTHQKLTPKVYDGVSYGWPALLSSMKSLLETEKSLVFTK